MITQEDIRHEFTYQLALKCKLHFADVNRIAEVNICDDLWGIRKIMILQVNDEKIAPVEQKMKCITFKGDDIFNLHMVDFSTDYIQPMIKQFTARKTAAFRKGEYDDDIE